MSRQSTRPSIRLWGGLALVIIIAVPVLTALGIYGGISWWQQQTQQSTIAAALRIVGSDSARWSTPIWQARARMRLAALGVDGLLFDATGHQVFATTNASLPRHVTGWQIWDGEKVGLPGGAGVATFFLPLFSQGTILTMALAAGLLALLPTLAGVAWFLERTIVRPLTAMSRAARGIEEGNLAVHLPASRVREVAEVAGALEAMSAGLREAERRQAGLEQERRLFIGAIAHDLRTPLFTLRAFLGGLKDGLATTPEKAAHYVEVCQEKAEALERLIGDLFSYSRLEYLEQTPLQEVLELSSLLRQAAESIQPQADAKGIIVTLDGPVDLCPFTGDRQMLMRAVHNVLDNAVRHTPPGGHIHLRWSRAAGVLAVAVEDAGPGIAADDLPHLFTPLYRGEPSRNRHSGGAGLGLTIARRILRAHGGDLVAANGATGGAVFTATLPANWAIDGRR
jgi:signal transduction histidine kinase